MNKVVSFSGGRTSAYLVYLMKNDPNAHFVFMDTGAEHPATYQFIRDIVEHWNINLVCLRVVYNETLGKGNDYKIIPVADIYCDLEPWLGMVKKQDILDWWKDQPFNLMIDEHLGNCVFCVKKSLGKVALVTRDYNPIPFIELVEGNQVRTEGRKINKLHMYRNRNSLSGIIDLYKDYSDEEILSKLKMTKSFDTNACSESCEVFGDE